MLVRHARGWLSAAVSYQRLIDMQAAARCFQAIAGGSGNFFIATLQHLASGIVTANEIIKVTATSTDTFTIGRAQEGTTAQAWAPGDTCALLCTAGGLAGFMQGPPLLSGSFTLTATGLSSGTTSGTAYYRTNGPLCTIMLPYLSGASNADTFTAVGIPSAIQMANFTAGLNNAMPLSLVENNGAFISGGYAIITPSSNVITYAILGLTNTWSNTGTKGVAGIISYLMY
jgi:hypothetical protein